MGSAYIRRIIPADTFPAFSWIHMPPGVLKKRDMNSHSYPVLNILIITG